MYSGDSIKIEQYVSFAFKLKLLSDFDVVISLKSFTLAMIINEHSLIKFNKYIDLVDYIYIILIYIQYKVFIFRVYSLNI